MIGNTSIGEVETEITALLNAKKRDFLTAIQIRNNLSAPILKNLGLTRKSSLNEIIAGLNPHIKKLKIFKTAENSYIGFAKPFKEMIVNTILRTPGLTSKQLSKKIPISNDAFIKGLNKLLVEGKILCTLNLAHVPRLIVSHISLDFHAQENNEIVQPTASTAQTTANTVQIVNDPIQTNKQTVGTIKKDRNDFKNAYDAVGKGKSFVRIHRIRNQLNWPVSHFDHVLSELMYDYTVQMHGGDPSKLTEKEIQDSFMDENHMLYITLTWRRK